MICICPSSGSSVVARSLVWPGAVAVVAGKKFINAYMVILFVTLNNLLDF